MKMIVSIVHSLAAGKLTNCLKYRHSIAVLVILALLAVSCGRVVNARKDMGAFSRNINFLLMEGQCNENPSADSKISKDIKELYMRTSQSAPQLFFSINPRFYNSDNPMVLSLETMEKSFQKIKGDPSQLKNAEELYHLFTESRRFEDQKCTFKKLIDQGKYDIRPYMNLGRDCYGKYQNEICDDAEFLDMSPEKEKWTQTNVIGLCKSFSRDVNCQAEYLINQRKKSIGSMIHRYYERFEKERYGAMFKLRSVHQKYKCQKTSENGEDKTIMEIKVLDSSFDHDLLVELMAFVEAAWSREHFSLKLELVKNYDDGVVVINSTNKGISYVPDNNNRLVYLSTMNDHETMKRVLAHEFGHVLGFPDCYIEFFDNSKKELVYYEISQKNTNIMCSLKSDVRVPDDYFTQLAQNSCLFN